MVPPDFFEKIIETGIYQDSAKVRLDRVSGRCLCSSHIDQHLLQDNPQPVKTDAEKQKRIVKGGYAVDPDTKLDLMNTHVYKKGEDGYDIMLSIADVQSGRNSFYSLQVRC